MDTFASRLVQACEQVGMKDFGRQSEIRRKLKSSYGLELSGQCVSNWFRGATTPRSETLDRLAKILGVDPAWLMFGHAKGASAAPRVEPSVPAEPKVRPVRLTDSLWAFVDGLIASGAYEDSGDVIRASLRDFQARHGAQL